MNVFFFFFVIPFVESSFYSSRWMLARSKLNSEPCCAQGSYSVSAQPRAPQSVESLRNLALVHAFCFPELSFSFVGTSWPKNLELCFRLRQ